MSAPTSYDEVTYPSLLFGQSSPDRLAVIGRLHGLAAPAVETARVLHIGGGDGLDAIALAAAYPQSSFVNFDLAAQPIARGQRWSEAAGLANIRHFVLDIMDADSLEGPFDYIVAHGVYAWVPDAVRAAILPLVARLLSPTGIAFISYNALPGGYTRMALRDMMLHHVGHVADPAARIAAAKQLLRDFAQPGRDDAPVTAAMRLEATVALTYADGLLFHDQLNGFYAPQALHSVTAAGQAAGLRYLGDARGGGLEQGFVDLGKADITDADLLRHLQTADYRSGRYFRTSLFVQAGAPFTRVLDIETSRTMWASTRARRADDGSFRLNDLTLRVSDPRHADMLTRLIDRGSGWFPVEEIAPTPDLRDALCRRALDSFADLHAAAPPFVTTPGDHPIASPFARAQIGFGERRIATLDHRLIDLDDPAERNLLQLLDGSRSVQELAGQTSLSQQSVHHTLGMFAARKLLTR